MNNRVRLVAVLVLGLVGAAISWTLLHQHHGEAWGSAAISAVCGPGESGCDVVNRSAYSAIAGIPVAAIGFVFYVSIAALALLAWLSGGTAASSAGRWAFWLVALALVVDVALLAVQAFSLKAFCKACLATYAVNVVLFFILRSMRGGTAPETAESASLPPEERVLIGGWAAATVLAAGFAYGVDGWLGAKQADREKGILGTPSTSSSAPIVGNDVVSLRAEVTRLQQALDDPEKRQRYDTHKAISEFDRAPVQSLDLTQTPFEGPAQAPISVVEFSDFMCPFCRSIAGAFAGYLPESNGRVKIYFKNFPLDQECNPTMTRTVHGGACRLALGGICASEQGKFWPYHNKVFSVEMQNPQLTDVTRLAAQSGLDAARFQACLASPAAAERLKKDVTEGQRIGVNATPTLLINGKKMARVNDFLEVVNREAKRLGLPEAPPSMLARPHPDNH